LVCPIGLSCFRLMDMMASLPGLNNKISGMVDSRRTMVAVGLRPPIVAIATLGCKVNQTESEQMLEQFEALGFEVGSFDGFADVYIINTCTVTHIADRKSRQFIRRAKAQNIDSLVIVTGCYASAAGDEVGAIEEIDLIVPKVEIAGLAERVAGIIGWSSLHPVQKRSQSRRTRAFVKIQDGCDDHCTYCIVPAARGASRSVRVAQVMGDVCQKLAQGYREIVLTGVHIGRYGRDFGADSRAPVADLAGLTRLILEQTDVERLRLTSIEPMDFDDSLLPLWQDERLARHLHLPLQSGSDSVLERMGRLYRMADFEELVGKLREAVPGIALTADIIVGFPGETGAEHRESLESARRMGFSKIHVFPYSARKGTPAADMPDQVHPDVKRARAEEMRRLSNESGAAYRASFTGRSEPVLFERCVTGSYGEHWEGLSGNYLRVLVASPDDLANRILPVRILSLTEDGLIGEIAG
jgi:threonylcarbamoyladenosine tRNA methylthiotransferase MtaB